MILKAGLALKNEYYLEASWIISALLEKRLKNILKKVENQKTGIGNLFDQNIKRIKHLHLTSQNPLLTNHFSIAMIDELRAWKNQRNEVMKDMLVRHVSKERMERLASQGVRMLKTWNACYQDFKSQIRNSG